MINDAGQSTSELTPGNPSAVSTDPATASLLSQVGPEKTKKSHWKTLGIIIGALFGCCLVSVAISAGFGYISLEGYRTMTVEEYLVNQVLESYMFAMKVKSAERAYELTSPRAKRQTSTSKIAEWFEGNNYILFDGYQSITIKKFYLSYAVNLDPDKPQGTVATVSGTVSYIEGTQGTFNATLEKVDDQWRVYGVSVSVPPSKFK